MDKQEYEEYVHRRKRRYMAQILETFEELCESQLSTVASQDFKGTVRRKLHAFAIDVTQAAGAESINGVAQDLRDRVWADTAPTTRGAD